ncbi:rodlin [Streptomyces sp. NPDC049555]|uniref:rodlin n=1 Tax=unclassified Streptomyces TaxID=2593676 RepID=UPI00342D3F06
MLKKFLATTALAVTAVGSLAGPAMAQGDDEQDGANANGAKTGYGNTRTGGKESPQMSLIQGTLNKPCIALQDIAAVLAITDIQLLSSNQEMQCTDNSQIVDGDDPLSEILDGIISGNGSFNSGGPGGH